MLIGIVNPLPLQPRAACQEFFKNRLQYMISQKAVNNKMSILGASVLCLCC